jgi:type IV pilus assembly protein PilE
MEVMIVLIILGILAGFALPAYQESVQKSRRSDAKQALLEVANREEQYMLDRSTYTADMTDLGYDVDPRISADGHYAVDRIATTECPLNTATCYVLEAKPVAGSAQLTDARCATFTLGSDGSQDATGTDKNNCW